MKSFIGLVVWVVLVCLLIPCHAQAQSKVEGLRLLKEADELREKPRSSDDRKVSLQKYERVLGIFQKVGYREGLGVALKNLGNLYMDLGQHQKALELYEKGLATAREVKDRNTEALILNNLGNVYKGLGQNDKAIEFYQKCIALSREVKERKGEALALNNLGDHRFYPFPGAVESFPERFQASSTLALIYEDHSARLQIHHNSQEFPFLAYVNLVESTPSEAFEPRRRGLIRHSRTYAYRTANPLKFRRKHYARFLA